MVLWDETPPERIAADRRALEEALTRLREVYRRVGADRSFTDGGLRQQAILLELEESLRSADAALRLVGLMLDVIIKEAPVGARDDAGVPVLDRIVRHAYTQDEITRNVTEFAAERAIELPVPADLKAYTTRSAATREAAQALLAAKIPNPDGTPKGPVYGLLLMGLGVDRMQLDDLISYLAAASRKVRDGET
ncbi:hypothetical protein [Streptomyces cinereoruber]|uniref:hypothetical protein n=1 Tax=Streptomyces cinereoruber TaxID=67260 RepID=UPI00363D2D82